MARPLRLEFAGALYHVTARGDRQEPIYEDDKDRQMFLGTLADVVERFNWLVHAYCLMGNHYHLLVETPDGNLAKGMRQLNGVFTQQSNRRHQRVGHLFQGRYKAILVQKQAYLLEVARYVVLNPVRAGMVQQVGAWPWSSYLATVGQAAKPVWLSTDWILSAFGSTRKQAAAVYRDFVAAGIEQHSLWHALRNQIFLGDEAFVDSVQKRIGQLDTNLQEVPRQQRAGRAKAIQDYAQQTTDRDEAIALAYASGGYSMREIGENFGLHYSRISRIVKHYEAKGKT